MTRTTRHALAAFATAAVLIAPTSSIASNAPPLRPGTEPVLYVGNNWEGTADIVDPIRFKRLDRINIVPDYAERIREIRSDVYRFGFFLGVRLLIGEGHDQLVDDMFSSHDGRYLYVSRPSFADVIGLDLKTRKIVWRTPVAGVRADHMAISPDGKKLLVSASTGNVVHQIDAASGKITGEFESGDSPHENNYSADGKLIYHASIGTVYTPTDDPSLDLTKGRRYLQIVDGKTLKVLRRVEMGKVLAASGFPGMSSAVRPMAVSPDEKKIFLQVSFFHGFAEYDIDRNRVRRLVHLPLSEKAKRLRRDEYVLDSAHHGLTINPAGTKLCAAGTMSDYAAIVSTSDFKYKIAHVGDKPYWSTNDGTGDFCFVSVSGEDRVSVISYDTGREVASIPVGDHPQRMRMGELKEGYIPGDRVSPRVSAVKVVRGKRGRRYARVRLSERAQVAVTVRRGARGGRSVRVRTVRRTLRGGARRVPLGRLRRGSRYRIVVTATDAAGNSSARAQARFRIRR